MKYYLDTNIIIYAMKNKYPNIMHHLKNISSESIVIPSIVMAEIEYGARKSIDYEKTMALYHKFTDVFEVATMDKISIITYGEIRSSLESEGKIIGPNDLIIASIVLSNDGILVTHNTEEFKRIQGLAIDDWCEG